MKVIRVVIISKFSLNYLVACRIPHTPVRLTALKRFISQSTHIVLKMHKMGKLNLDVEVGDTLHIGEAKVQIVKKSGRLARLSIEADKNIEIKHKRKSASDSDKENQAHG